MDIDRLGNIYFTSNYDGAIYVLTPQGFVTTIAGNMGVNQSARAICEVGSGYALSTNLYFPHRLKVGPNGDVVFNTLNQCLVQMNPTGSFKQLFDDDGAYFQSKDGLNYVFDNSGRHLRTEDQTTGKTLLTFDYDEQGDLAAIIDRFKEKMGTSMIISVKGKNEISLAPSVSRLSGML